MLVFQIFHIYPTYALFSVSCIICRLQFKQSPCLSSRTRFYSRVVAVRAAGGTLCGKHIETPKKKTKGSDAWVRFRGGSHMKEAVVKAMSSNESTVRFTVFKPLQSTYLNWIPLTTQHLAPLFLLLLSWVQSPGHLYQPIQRSKDPLSRERWETDVLSGLVVLISALNWNYLYFYLFFFVLYIFF